MAESSLPLPNEDRSAGDEVQEQRDRLLTDTDDGRSASKDPSVDACSQAPSTSQDEKAEESKDVPSRKLQRFRLILLATVVYAIVAVFAWAITCILVYRPIPARRYGLWLQYNDSSPYHYPSPDVYLSSERLFRATRVLQTIVAVATLPLVSAICSSAAVVFVQRSCNRRGTTLRQTVVLADKGWTALDVYGQLFRGRWAQYGSRLLYIAIVLNLLGAIIAPFQSVFTSITTKQVPGLLGKVQSLSDYSDLLGDANDPDNSLAAATLRAAISSTSTSDPQIRLWTATGATNCTGSSSSNGTSCISGQVSLGNMSALDDPFVAQLPAGYSTGVVRQFLPRVNSSVTRERIDAAAFPTNCNYDTSSFYANYSTAVWVGYDENRDGSPSILVYHLEACMPGNQTSRPLDLSRPIQDLSETLYLNLTASNPPSTDFVPADQWSGYFRITINTTSGYFELPNYMNVQRPGPLLSENVDDACGRDCLFQHLYGGSSLMYKRSERADDILGSTISRRSNDSAEIAEYKWGVNGTTVLPVSMYAVNALPNKGPLLTIALALFGPDSFVADIVTHPEQFITSGENLIDKCTDLVPFAELLEGSSDGVCSNNYNFGQVSSYVLNYVQLFIGPSPGQSDNVDYATANESYDQRLTNAFAAAAFLANEQWLTSAPSWSWAVYYDPGVPVEAPHISRAGIILNTVLLSVYLLGLIAVALYSTRDARWTSTFDALAMMQYGAAIASQLPLKVVGNARRLKVLDETSGWIGDGSGGLGDVGELSLGAATRLRAGRKYQCFEHDHETGAHFHFHRRRRQSI